MHYATSFTGTENPLSEGGVWLNPGTQGGTKVKKENGKASGTQDDTTGYNENDSYAICQPVTGGGIGFPADQRAVAKVYRHSGLDDQSETHEDILYLRASNGSSRLRAYECHVDFLGQFQIIRLNGDGTLAILETYNGPVPADGDDFEANVSGTLITLKLNGTTIVTHDDTDDAKITSGDPGIGFFTRDQAHRDWFSFKHFEAWNL